MQYNNAPSTTNWKLCVLCQVLQYPARSSKLPIGSGYVSLAKDLLAFQELGKIPAGLVLDWLDDGSGIKSTLKTNQAQWHKTCRLTYNQAKMQRWQKVAKKLQQSDQQFPHGLLTAISRLDSLCASSATNQLVPKCCTRYQRNS